MGLQGQATPMGLDTVPRTVPCVNLGDITSDTDIVIVLVFQVAFKIIIMF